MASCSGIASSVQFCTNVKVPKPIVQTFVRSARVMLLASDYGSAGDTIQACRIVVCGAMWISAELSLSM